MALLFVSTGHIKGQSWQTAVMADDTWRYFVGTSEPPADWYQAAFNDASWTSGPGGFGYGDGDDGTIIPNTLSVYLRIKFDVVSLDAIASALLHVDFDDAFVAYLNGEEVARSNIGTTGIPPAFDATANEWHEAQLYQGVLPDAFILSSETISTTLAAGENILALQVHNYDIGSSDLSSAAWLSFEINDGSTDYRSTPVWFEPPVSFTSSNLPIVVINTSGQFIPDEPKITAHMGIINNGPGLQNNLTDTFTDYNGYIGIEMRGKSSLGLFPKKAYSVETRDSLGENLNVSLMGMPEENDWILYAPYSDKSLLRNVLTFKMGELTGRYSSRTGYCEVVLNGEYMGIYVLMEKVKRDQNRVDVAKLRWEDTLDVEITGGYILRMDKTEDLQPGDGWTSFPNPGPVMGNNVFIQYYDPETEEFHPQQQSYIQNWFYEFESNLNSSGFKNLQDGYPKYIDMGSFVDFFLVNELSKDIDNFLFSTYFYKDKETDGGKLNMGPLWDFNLGYGNFNYGPDDADETYGFIYVYGDRLYWYRRLMQDINFRNALRCRWDELRSGPFETGNLVQFIDSVTTAIDEAQQRNFQRWPTLGSYVWPNPDGWDTRVTYQDEVNALVSWLIGRLDWMDNNIPGICVPAGNKEAEMASDSRGISAFPNPFNNEVTISVNMEVGGNVDLHIFSLTGQRVKTISQYNLSAGQQNIIWRGQSDQGVEAPPGMYIVIVKTGPDTIAITKLMKQ